MAKSRATKTDKKFLEYQITKEIDLWFNEMGYDADGADHEEKALTEVLNKIVFAYLGKEIK